MGEQIGVSSAPRMIQVDHSTAMLIDLLEDKMGSEPPIPNEDHHVGARYTELARAHEQWQRECDALRLLCGIRLVDRAVA